MAVSEGGVRGECSQCSGFPGLTSMDAMPSSLPYIQQPGTLGTGLKRHGFRLAHTRNRRGTLGTRQQNSSTRIDGGRKPVLCKTAQRQHHPNCAPGDNESKAAMATTDNNLHIPDDLLAQAEKL